MSFTVVLGDGREIDVDAPDAQSAAAAVRKFSDREKQAKVDALPEIGGSNGAGNGMSRGMQAAAEGIGLMAGGPVDLVSLPVNAAISGINRVAGTNIPHAGSMSERFARQYREGVAEGQNPELRYKRREGENFLQRLLPDSPFRVAGDIAGTLGAEPVDVEKLPTSEKFAYNLAKAGTAMVTGGNLGALRSTTSLTPTGAPAVDVARNAMADLVAPARNASAKTVAGDIGAGAGIAAAETAISENRDNLAKMGLPGKVIEAVAPFAGGLAGGVGTAGLTNAAKGIKGAVLGPEKGLPVDPNTGAPYPARVVNQAADHIQANTLNPEAAARALQENTTALRGQGVERLPTSGLLTDDPGMIGVENSFRQKPDDRASARLVQVDKQVDTEAANRIAGMAPGSDPRLPATVAEQQAAALRQPHEQQIAALDPQVVAAQERLAQEGASVQQYAPGRDAAARNLDRTVVDDGLRPSIREKNERFDAIDPNATKMRPTAPYEERVRQIRAEADTVPPELRHQILPDDYLRAIEGFAPRIEQQPSAILGADGRPVMRDVNVGGPGEVPMQTITRMVPLLSAAEAQARSAKQFPLADNIRALRQEMGQEAERLAATGDQSAIAAVEHYRRFADVWAQGPGDAATRFRQDYNRDPTNRSTTPPSETADRFLKSPEDAQSLNRVANSLDNPQAALGPAREVVLGDLARSGALDSSGRINLHNLRGWLNRNGDTAAAIPGLREELDGIARQATDSQAAHTRLTSELEAARDRLKLTQSDIDRGILGQMIGRDPHNLVEGLLSSKDPQMSLRSAVTTLRDNPEAMRGLAGAIREFISDSATNSNVQKTLDGSRPVSPAKLENLMNRFGDALAEALPPGEMQKLRATQAQLQPRQNLGVKAVVGSDTNSNQQHALLNMVDLGLRAQLGGIQGNAGTRLIKGILQMAGVQKDPRIGQLILGAIEKDPETLGQLLLRDTRKTPAANWRANSTLGAAVGLQEASK